MKYIITGKLFIISLFLLLSCNKAEVAMHKSENEALKAQLKECVSIAKQE